MDSLRRAGESGMMYCRLGKADRGLKVHLLFE